MRLCLAWFSSLVFKSEFRLAFENNLGDGLLRGVRDRKGCIFHAQPGGDLAGFPVKSDGWTPARQADNFAIPPTYPVAPARS